MLLAYIAPCGGYIKLNAAGFVQLMCISGEGQGRLRTCSRHIFLLDCVQNGNLVLCQDLECIILVHGSSGSTGSNLAVDNINIFIDGVDVCSLSAVQQFEKWYDSGEKVGAINILEGIVLRKKSISSYKTGRDAFLYLTAV